MRLQDAIKCLSCRGGDDSNDDDDADVVPLRRIR